MVLQPAEKSKKNAAAQNLKLDIGLRMISNTGNLKTIA
jgi:hypothetical protein